LLPPGNQSRVPRASWTAVPNFHRVSTGRAVESRPATFWVAPSYFDYARAPTAADFLDKWGIEERSSDSPKLPEGKLPPADTRVESFAKFAGATGTYIEGDHNSMRHTAFQLRAAK